MFAHGGPTPKTSWHPKMMDPTKQIWFLEIWNGSNGVEHGWQIGSNMGACLGLSRLLPAGLRISRTGFRHSGGWHRWTWFPGHTCLLRRCALGLGLVFFALFGAGTGSFGTLPVRRILTTRLTLNLFGLGFLAAIGLKIELPRKQPATAGGPKRVSKLCEVLYTEELDLDFECSNSGHAISCNHTRDGIVSACSGTPKGSRSCTLE